MKTWIFTAFRRGKIIYVILSVKLVNKCLRMSFIHVVTYHVLNPHYGLGMVLGTENTDVVTMW